MINYYIVAGISLLCIIVNLLILHENDLLSKTVIDHLKTIAYFIMFEILIDTLIKALEGFNQVPHLLLYVIKTIEFSLGPVLPFLILKIFIIAKQDLIIKHNQMKQIDRIQMLQIVIVVINIIFQFFSLFMQFMFYLDKDNIYQREYLAILYTISIIINVSLLIFAISIFSNQMQSKNILTLSGFFVVFTVGFILRIFYNDTNFDWLCVSITFFITVIYYSNLTLKLDPLTKLLNRQAYNVLIDRIDRINFTTLIIIVDANNFKKINDTFGHEYGDNTLKTFADCIYETYGEYAWCFRLGGDEFCIILKPDSFDKLVNENPGCDKDSIAINQMKKLDENIKSFAKNSNDNYLAFGVSKGHGIYDINKDMSIKDVLRLADDRMYQEKMRMKEKEKKQNQ